MYDFKKITAIPPPKDMVDIVLSKTQRKTPTEIHPQYAIHRLRAFYMRKVKFTQQTIHDKLTKIIEDFPRLDDIHPFYAQLMGVLYDRDHYKLALGQINLCRNYIDSIGRDYVRLLKYADSQYRCKRLKVAALGRMATKIRRLTSLNYLEEVRQHMARLPSIDPTQRTVILCGYPNVGKSSLLNKVTKAHVDVQSYPFTTKSLFVGHFEHASLIYQIIDTPGVLDKPLEDRNIIEMQSITALAHLRCAVSYMFDLSEQCGFSIEQQVKLFHNMFPLFTSKPTFVILSKSDLKTLEQLEQTEPERAALVRSCIEKATGTASISSKEDVGVQDAMDLVCGALLKHRVEKKLQYSNEKTASLLARVQVALPESGNMKPRNIPEAVQRRLEGAMDDEDDMEQEIDIERREGYGQYHTPSQKFFILDNEEWKNDSVPEFMDGKNIADFVDPDILEKLEALEREEAARLQQKEENPVILETLTETERADLNDIETAKKRAALENKINRSANRSALPRKYRAKSFKEIQERLMQRGMLKEDLEEARSHSVVRSREQIAEDRLKGRSVSQVRQLEELEERSASVLDKRHASLANRKRSQSNVDRFAGIMSPYKQIEAVRSSYQKQRKFARLGKHGITDFTVPDLKPKHLLTGKMGLGTRNKR